jgi:hypothetical protein
MALHEPSSESEPDSATTYHPAAAACIAAAMPDSTTAHYSNGFLPHCAWLLHVLLSSR